jgi:cobalt-zinc-cadmium efflux system membrane fusion protein
MSEEELRSEDERPSEHAGSPRRRRLVMVGGLVILLAVGLLLAGQLGAWGIRWRRVDPPGESSRSATPAPASSVDAGEVTLDDQQLQRMKLEPVQLRDFQVERSAIGRIAFNDDRTTPVFTAYAGRVVRLIAKPADEVQRGSPLGELDTPDLVQAESDFLNASAGVRKARNQLEHTERNAGRQRDLFSVKAVAEKDLQQAEADFRNAQSDLRGAEGTFAATRDRLRLFGKTDRDLALLEERRQVDPHMVLVAPIGGTVTSRKVGPGQWVKPDSPDPLFTIADLSIMWLLANVAEPDIPFVQVGQSVEVQVSAYPREVFHAQITNVGAAVDPVTRRVAVRADLPDPRHKLKPDMFASFRILTGAPQQGLGVPASALVRVNDKTTVWVQIAPKRVARREVTLGMEQGGLVQVVRGLQAGERVVVDGGLFLSNAEQAASRAAGPGPEKTQ